MPQQFAATYEAFLAAVHPEDRAVVDAAYSGSLREGKDSYEIEHRIVRQQSGEIRYVHEKCVHERDAAGVVIRSVGMVQDITTRKRTEEKLRESEERYRLINASSRDSIYSYDRQGRFTHANLSLCNLLGLESGQIVGKTHEELGFTREHCQEWAKLHQQVYATDSTVINEMTTPIEGEALRCFEVVLNPMHDESGAIVGISGTTRDITARKRAEVALQEKLAELERINKLMIGRENRMIELKREINELCGQLNLPKRYSAPETIAPDSSQSKP